MQHFNRRCTWRHGLWNTLRSLYTVPRFFQHVDIKFEREHGPEQATVVTGGRNDLALLNGRRTPLPPALQTLKVKKVPTVTPQCELYAYNPLQTDEHDVHTHRHAKPRKLYYSCKRLSIKWTASTGGVAAQCTSCWRSLDHRPRAHAR